MMEHLFDTGSVEFLASLLGAVSKDKDCLELARGLLLRYGSLDNVFSSDTAQLSSVVGAQTALYLKICAHVTGRRVTDQFRSGECYTQREICEYLKALYIADSEEKVYIITLDAEERVIATHLVSHGTVNASEVLPRKFVEFAILDNAKCAIVAHNHPRGNTTPSSDDMQFTAKIASVFSVSGIHLLYSVIVAGQEARILDVSSTLH